MRDEEHISENITATLKNKLIEIYKRKKPPHAEKLINIVDEVNKALARENEAIRPYCMTGRGAGQPGGIVILKKDIPTIIVPDLHARMDFFLTIMLSVLNSSPALEDLSRNALQIVCVGDGFHAEGRAAKRWHKAYEEYSEKFARHHSMDDEMREGLGVMEMVMQMKIAFPDNFHFLKGNHENIMNERGDGNFPFRKYAYEGAMVFEYMNIFYGQDFLKSYSEFEKRLPLLAVGRNFMVSHAEPQNFFEYDEVLQYKDNPHVIRGLTWTDNNAAEGQSVRLMLETYLDLPDLTGCYYFGGHRAVLGNYSKRADGKYIQIHNPNKFIVAMLPAQGDIDLEKYIFELKNIVPQIV
jgi:hypothetical protein